MECPVHASPMPGQCYCLAPRGPCASDWLLRARNQAPGGLWLRGVLPAQQPFDSSCPEWSHACCSSCRRDPGSDQQEPGGVCHLSPASGVPALAARPGSLSRRHYRYVALKQLPELIWAAVVLTLRWKAGKTGHSRMVRGQTPGKPA